MIIIQFLWEHNYMRGNSQAIFGTALCVYSPSHSFHSLINYNLQILFTSASLAREYKKQPFFITRAYAHHVTLE